MVYSLYIQVVDSGLFKAVDYQKVKFQLLNVNDPPLIFNSVVIIAIAEYSPAESIVSPAVLFTDEDTIDNHENSITAGNVDGAFFIDSSGIISTTNSLNFEDVATYSLTIHVTDSGMNNLFALATIVIDVVNVNEAPEIMNHGANQSIVENAAAILM